jgi:hypothetical protein
MAAIMAEAATPDEALVTLAVVMRDQATHVAARAASGAVRLAADSTVAEAEDSTEVGVVASTAAEADTANL